MSADPLAALKARVEGARGLLRATPATGPGVYGSPDPETGERWNAGNVLGHVAEMLPFWTGQVASILEGATEAGRGTAGYESRRTGIDSGQELGEEELRSRIEAGLVGLLELLSEMRPSDLERPILYRARVGEEELSLGLFLEQLLIGHIEGHLQQLAEFDG